MWSPDPYKNLKIGGDNGTQTVPKIAATSDGGCFIAWFANIKGNYDVYLQRLDKRGNTWQNWDVKGLCISNKPSMDHITDYDLIVDDKDNAVVVFSDIRQGKDSLNVYAYKVDSDKKFLWGKDGIVVTEGTGFNASPKVAQTTNGSYAVAWVGDSNMLEYVQIQMLLPDGGLGSHISIPGQTSGDSTFFPQVVGAKNGNFIVSWVSSSGDPMNYENRIFTQKYTSECNPLWGGNPVPILDLKVFPPYEWPGLQYDGDGGAFYYWHDYRDGKHFNSYVQHLTTDGTAQFPKNGAEVSKNAQFNHFYPVLSYSPDSGDAGDVSVFWREQKIGGGRPMEGIYAQKFSSTGERLWSDNGKQIIPIQEMSIGYLRNTTSAAGTVLYYEVDATSGGLQDYIKVTGVNNNGRSLWKHKTMLVSGLVPGVSNQKCYLNVSVTKQRMGIAVWSGGPNCGGSIFAQNVNSNGTLGPSTHHWRYLPQRPRKVPFILHEEAGE